MFNVNDILLNLKNDMSSSIVSGSTYTNNVSGGSYSNSPMVELGLTPWDKVDVYPYIGITTVGIDPVVYIDNLSSNQFDLKLVVYGYTKEDIVNNSEESILSLIDDLFAYLFSDCIYKYNICDLEEVVVSSGSKNESIVLAFSFSLTLKFN